MSLAFENKQRSIATVFLMLLSLLVIGCGNDDSPSPDGSGAVDIEGPAFVLFYTNN